MNICLLVVGLVVGCASGPGAAPRATPPVPADRWFAEDKARHFGVSFAAVTFGYGGSRTVLDPASSRAVAAGAASLLGLAKEVADARAGGRFSPKDLVWDVAGISLGLLLVHGID